MCRSGEDQAYSREGKVEVRRDTVARDPARKGGVIRKNTAGEVRKSGAPQHGLGLIPYGCGIDLSTRRQGGYHGKHVTQQDLGRSGTARRS